MATKRATKIDMTATKRNISDKGKRLTKQQRNLIMMWLAAGFTARETAAKAEEQGIVVSFQTVAKYKPKIIPQIADIVEQKETSALKQGIAIKENRVQKLAEMEALVYESIRQRVANGYSVEALIREWRGLLDDAAKEMGERKGTPAINNFLIGDDALAALKKTYQAESLPDPNVIDGEYTTNETE